MKNIKKYFGLTLAALLMTAFTGCKEEDDFGSDNLGLGIKVFTPTKVVPGQPVTINGSGFSEVTSVVFPGDIAVSSFELVSNEMIRVITPAGIHIADEGEKLIVRSANHEAESPRLMTQGHTQVTAFSEEPGADVKGKSIIKVFGKDMEFVNKATFINSDNQVVELAAKDLYRIATNSVAIKVPANVKEGKQVATIETIDGKKFELPEYNYMAAAGGHWETTKKILWENIDNAPIPGWGGTFRFGLEGTEDPKNPCIATFDAETWNSIIKDGTFRAAVEVSETSNIRITTGWWQADLGGTEHNCIDFVEEDEDGNKYIELTLKDASDLYEKIDEQNLLFTGDAYTLKCLYTEEQVWVEESEGHWERKSLWKNTDNAPIPGWGGTFRFGLEGTEDPKNPCIALFDQETWNSIIKDGTFRAAVEVSETSNIRITTGWWQADLGGTEHNCIDFVEEDEDGNKYIELTLKDASDLYEKIDEQNLLFTGDAYTLKELYLDVWVEETDDPKPVVLWENTDNVPLTDWGGTFRFGLEGTEDPKNPCIATFDQETWNQIKEGEIYFLYDGNEGSNVRITTGWWQADLGGTEHNCIDMAEDDPATGLKVIKINIKEEVDLYDKIDEQNLLFTGSAYTPMKLYYYK